MTGKARGSPTTRNVIGLQERMARLERFAEWGNVRPIAFEGMISKTVWKEYWAQLEVVLDAMRVAQERVTIVREGITRGVAQSIDR